MRRILSYTYKKILIPVASIMLLFSCSVTKNLPEGEILYTGQKTKIDNPYKTPLGETALEEINAALKKTPSTNIFGFAPIPFKMWMYNDFVHYKKGFGRWMFKRFAADPPIYISTVNPDIRIKVAGNLLHDYGYFNGDVTQETIVDKHDTLKAQIKYTVDMGRPFTIDTVFYRNFNNTSFNILKYSQKNTYLICGRQFSVTDLDEERTRLSTLLRNRGYYYFNPEYLSYEADTTRIPYKVSLRIQPIPGLPANATRPYMIGKTTVYLSGKNDERPNDSLLYRDMSIYYYNKLIVRPDMLYRWLHYSSFFHHSKKSLSNHSIRNPKLYSLRHQQRIQERLAELGIFRNMNIQYLPKDSTQDCDTLNMRMNASFDKPLSAELQLNVTTKSNDQTGPGASFSVTKNNIFGGGESLNVKIKGSYEWQTGNERNNSLMNSWEMGISSSLTFPKVVFHNFGKREFDFPATTTFGLYIDQLNRAKYYKLLSFGGNATYDFQPTKTTRHSLTPFKLTFNVLQYQTDAFKAIADENPALYVSLKNQFIPAMEYTYTFDNSTDHHVKNTSWWQTTLTSAGNVTSCIYRFLGKPFNEKNKDLLGAPFAQFVKLNSEYRYTWNLDKNNSIAFRTAAGAIFCYGNTTVAPYSEQFYVGGANSIRAFTIRSIGPGGYSSKDKKYSFLDQTGSMRLEGNAEYRFKIYNNFHGALFLDAGNVWLLRKDENRSNSQFQINSFAKQIALGTGFGLRYDIDILVFRLDFGIPLHDPYDTKNSGYYNITGSFFKNLGIHFAIGYPF